MGGKKAREMLPISLMVGQSCQKGLYTYVYVSCDTSNNMNAEMTDYIYLGINRICDIYTSNLIRSLNVEMTEFRAHLGINL